MRTADLCDAHEGQVRVAEPVFRDFGAVRRFAGPVVTLKVFEDNALVRTTLETRGQGRVLVVDGGGSLACALLGGNLAKLMETNGWAGIVVFGAVRDAVELADAKVGIKALALVPRRARKTGAGTQGDAVTFAGITASPGEMLYADEDGVVIAASALSA